MKLSAQQLKEAFDRSFALPISAPEPEREPVLVIRAGGEVHALRVGELMAVESAKKITPLPVGGPSQLGIVGVRGRVFAAYDLGRILGAQTDCLIAGVAPWVMVSSGDEPIAFAFAEVLSFSAPDLEAAVSRSAQLMNLMEIVRTLRGSMHS